MEKDTWKAIGLGRYSMSGLVGRKLNFISEDKEIVLSATISGVVTRKDEVCISIAPTFIPTDTSVKYQYGCIYIKTGDKDWRLFCEPAHVYIPGQIGIQK